MTAMGKRRTRASRLVEVVVEDEDEDCDGERLYGGKRFAAGGRGERPRRVGEMELLVVGRWRMLGRRFRVVDVVGVQLVVAKVGEMDVHMAVGVVALRAIEESSVVRRLHVDEDSSSRRRVCVEDDASWPGGAPADIPAIHASGVFGVAVRSELSD